MLEKISFLAFFSPHPRFPATILLKFFSQVSINFFPFTFTFFSRFSLVRVSFFSTASLFVFLCVKKSKEKCEDIFYQKIFQVCVCVWALFSPRFWVGWKFIKKRKASQAVKFVGRFEIRNFFHCYVRKKKLFLCWWWKIFIVKKMKNGKKKFLFVCVDLKRKLIKRNPFLMITMMMNFFE